MEILLKKIHSSKIKELTSILLGCKLRQLGQLNPIGPSNLKSDDKKGHRLKDDPGFNDKIGHQLQLNLIIILIKICEFSSMIRQFFIKI